MSQLREPLQIDLVLLEIFGHLPLYDLLVVCEICKLWRTVGQDLILKHRKELALFHKLLPRPMLWQHDQRPVDLSSSLVVNGTFKRSDHLKETFKEITSLYIASYEVIFLDRDELSDFVHSFGRLEHLEIHQLNDLVESTVPYEIQLNAPNLRTLWLNGYNDRVVKLNCPKLRKLSVIDNFQMNADFSSINLRFLKVKSFAYHRLIRLLSLETLMFCKSVQIHLADFPSLKRIHLFGHKKGHFNETEREQMLRGLFEQRRNLRRNELEVFYEGMRCTEDSVREVIDSNKSQFGSLFNYKSYEFYRHNGDRFDFKRVSKVLKYSESFNEELKNVNSEHTDQLSGCIHHLHFGKNLKNQINFTNWQNMFRYVSSVAVRRLPQDQLDELPNQLPSLVEFSFFTAQSSEKDTVVNFEFVSRFQTLKCFNIERGLVSLDEFKLILNSCRFFYYAILNPSIHCKLQPNGSYYLRTTRYKEKFEFLSKKCLFSFLESKNLIVKND